MQVTQKYFSFAEIVQGRDASVRVTDDGYVYAVDLVMVVTGQSRDDAGKILRRLTDDIFPSDKMSERKMPGKGNAHTKVLTFQNAIELIMALPGHDAKEIRVQFSRIINRYLAGDHTLISEIQANAASDSPVAQMARKSLGIATEEDLLRKRRREDLELDKLQQDIVKMQQDIQAQKRQAMVTHVHSYMETMEMLDADWKKDQRLVVQLKDLLTNVTMGHRPVTDGKSGSDQDAIYVTMVARELGYTKLTHGQDCKVGRELARLYREKHGKEPPTCKRLVNGTEMIVKHYTKLDRDIMERAIHRAMK
jgi:hypothetical protein